jgi:hypothetical protein
MTEGLREDPRTSINWRTHRTGCPHYRERWLTDTDTAAGEPLYQVFCALNTPPISAEEQAKCLISHTACWRLVTRPARAARAAKPDPAVP